MLGCVLWRGRICLVETPSLPLLNIQAIYFWDTQPSISSRRMFLQSLLLQIHKTTTKFTSVDGEVFSIQPRFCKAVCGERTIVKLFCHKNTSDAKAVLANHWTISNLHCSDFEESTPGPRDTRSLSARVENPRRDYSTSIIDREFIIALRFNSVLQSRVCSELTTSSDDIFIIYDLWCTNGHGPTQCPRALSRPLKTISNPPTAWAWRTSDVLDKMLLFYRYGFIS